ncbi:hypothetical protein [Lactococcus sp. DD01]|nr:hypothetical protein [Lactococcus sp. DD01]KXT61902.1 hypothetical protein LACDD01_01233 [Lactococcus sp. DD01]
MAITKEMKTKMEKLKAENKALKKQKSEQQKAKAESKKIPAFMDFKSKY